MWEVTGSRERAIITFVFSPEDKVVFSMKNHILKANARQIAVPPGRLL